MESEHNVNAEAGETVNAVVTRNVYKNYGDVEALRDFVLKELKSIASVSETTTMLILESVKSTQ